MKRVLIASSTVLAVLMMVGLGSGSAFAQKKGKKGGGDAGDGGNAKTKSYDFSADNIEGELVKPDGEMVKERKYAEHTSLIRVRADFIREIVKSAEEL
jgi:hypothetical protein